MDKGQTATSLSVGVDAPLHEDVLRETRWMIERFDAPIEWYGLRAARAYGTQDEVDLVERLLDPTGGGDWHRMPEGLALRADALFRDQVAPYDVSDFAGNLLLFNTTTSGGVALMWSAIIGATFTTNAGGSAPAQNSFYNNAQARLAVGDSATAETAANTWLLAATNKYAQGMDATFPSMADAHTVQFKITVTSLNANYAWAEFVTDNGNVSTSTSTTYTGQSALNRKTSSQGTKASGQTWALTETIALT